MVEISSNQNPRIKEVVHLRDRRDRDSTGTFLIEGYREIFRAVAAGWKMERLFICPALFLGENEGALIENCKKAKTEILMTAKNVFQKISYRDRPDGLLAVARQRKHVLSDFTPKKTPFFVVAEAIEKPGNLGTILRTCDAVGVDGLIVADPMTDIYNPNVVRASVGTLFTVPIAIASTDETITYLKRENVAIIAATPHATTLYTAIDYTRPVAIAFGTEQLGLKEVWMDTEVVRIPMKGAADSLNVATSTAVLLYEVLRQRGC